MNTPWVASAACCRKTVEFALEASAEAALEDFDPGPDEGVGRGSWRTSIGMERRWHAKMAFMMGMY
jgi:hypothetical protein